MSAKVVSYVPQAINAVGKGTIKGMLRTGEQVTAQAKALAPVDSGQLRNSISYGQDGDDVIVSASAEHAVYQEFGTRNMSAQPFFRPAIEIIVNGRKAWAAMAKALNDSVGRGLKKK